MRVVYISVNAIDDILCHIDTVDTDQGKIQFVNWFEETEQLLQMIGARSGKPWREVAAN